MAKPLLVGLLGWIGLCGVGNRVVVDEWMDGVQKGRHGVDPNLTLTKQEDCLFCNHQLCLIYREAESTDS